MLCSVVKHLGSGDITQEVGRNTHLTARVSPCTSFALLPLPVCFTTKQSTVEASLFVKYRTRVTYEPSEMAQLTKNLS